MHLPIQPPIKPMLATLTREMPDGGGWLYEPKWDGFRALVFWDGDELLVQSRDLKPLGRYFPELERDLRCLPAGVVVDGEIVIVGEHGLDFEALLQRIHPAKSRIDKLAAETPSALVAFDLLAADGRSLMDNPIEQRRACLEKLLGDLDCVYLTPATTDRERAQDWFERFEGAGLDGVVAKRLEDPYVPGQRTMAKVKHQRTVDCVIGGFRWLKDEDERAVGSLLLGLYDACGTFQHVGHTSSFSLADKRKLVDKLAPYRATDGDGAGGFGRGRTPGEPSRWSHGKDLSWEPLRPELVCEVAFDHLQGDRLRHAATFLRWRPDKAPSECTYEQLEETVPFEIQAIFGR